ncbi:MAG: tail fiber domain-containing protein, partial [Verrucomicrobiae bacterium]|nr:tail fiber domain-containing protein [Verrucomicrobiae bacterium]
DFAPISPAQMLDKVAQLPVSEWSYKEDPQTRHVGPVAQDFYSVFNIATDDKHIAPIDEGGVALAAIQGLNQKLTEKNADILQLKRQNDSLANRLKELEQLVQSLAETK